MIDSVSHAPGGGNRYALEMATIFIKHSEKYIQQIEAEIERLQQLREQVWSLIQSTEDLENEESEPQAPRKRAAKKGAGKKTAGKKAATKKRGRPRKTEAQAQA